MNKIIKKVALLISVVLYANIIFSQNTYCSKEFANTIIDRYSNINDLTNKGWEYSNSIVLIGIEKLYYETGDIKYLAYIKNYIDNYIDSNGNISFDENANNLDHLHPGWLCITLYEELGLEKYKKAADNIRAEFDNQPRNSLGGFWHKQRYENQMWADGIYMAEPFLIRYGATFDDLEYCANEATKQAILLADHAYDSTKNLMLHGWDDSKTASWADSQTGTSPEVWSRGMGWYCMALVDILDYLPKSHTNYNRIIEILNGLAIGIKKYQDSETGLWYQVVDKGNLESNWHETSGSSMFVYSLKKAIDNKYIDSATFMPTVQKGWEGLQSKITLDNKNQPVINDFVFGMGIKDSYDSYVAQDRVSTPGSRYPHGYCGILLASSAMEFPLPEFYTLEVTTTGSGSVTISNESDDYESGTEVELTAVPADGWGFVSWSGSIKDTNNPLTIKVDSSITIQADFLSLPNDITNVKAEPIQLYSNVVSNELTFKINERNTLQTYYIVNSLGEVVYKKTNNNLNTNLHTIDISMLNKGIYFLVINGTNKKYTSRFIKIK